MNINILEDMYISDEREKSAEISIKEHKRIISEEEIVLRKKNIVNDIFVELLNAQPRRVNGEWIVNGTISRRKQNNCFGEVVARDEDLVDFQYASYFLNECGIPNKIDLRFPEFIFLHFELSLQERDELEQYMISNEQEGVLKRIKI